ncbi:hypothetical protein DM01DRAFT_327167, partial [Hesseltinella vesiculosa]
SDSAIVPSASTASGNTTASSAASTTPPSPPRPHPPSPPRPPPPSPPRPLLSSRPRPLWRLRPFSPFLLWMFSKLSKIARQWHAMSLPPLPAHVSPDLGAKALSALREIYGRSAEFKSTTQANAAMAILAQPASKQD